MVIICIANSWYHSLGAYSYLLDRFDGEKPVEKMIYYSGGFFDVKANSLSPSYFETFCEELEVIGSWECLDSSINRIPDNERCLLVTASKLPYRAIQSLKVRNLNVSLLLIEEGIGSYGGAIQEIRAKLRESHGWMAKSKSFVFYIVKKIIISKYYLTAEKWLNFNPDGSLNQRVVNSYKRALTEISKELSDRAVGFEKVVFTSPFVELGMQLEEEYFIELSDMDVKGDVLVKPHPIESWEKYERNGFNVYKGNLSAELLISSLPSKPKVYCFSSTSLYTSKIFFDLTVLRIKELDRFYESLSSLQKKIIDSCAG